MTPLAQVIYFTAIVNISQINDILTFKPQVSMEIGIEKMLKYYNLAD
jgi:hypothetical protein